MAITVAGERAEPSLITRFGSLRINADLTAERGRVAHYLDAQPDRTLALVAEMNLDEPVVPPGIAVALHLPHAP